MGLFSKKVAEPVVLKYDEEKSVRIGWVLNHFAREMRQVSDIAVWNEETRRTEPLAATLTYEEDPRGNRSIAVRVNRILIGFLSSTVNDELTPAVKRGPVKASVVLRIEGRDRLCANACPAIWLD